MLKIKLCSPLILCFLITSLATGSPASRLRAEIYFLHGSKYIGTATVIATPNRPQSAIVQDLVKQVENRISSYFPYKLKNVHDFSISLDAILKQETSIQTFLLHEIDGEGRKQSREIEVRNLKGLDKTKIYGTGASTCGTHETRCVGRCKHLQNTI